MLAMASAMASRTWSQLATPTAIRIGCTIGAVSGISPATVAIVPDGSASATCTASSAPISSMITGSVALWRSSTRDTNDPAAANSAA